MTIPKDLAKKRDEYAQELVKAAFQEGVLAAFESEHVLALVEALKLSAYDKDNEHAGLSPIKCQCWQCKQKYTLANWSKMNE